MTSDKDKNCFSHSVSSRAHMSLTKHVKFHGRHYYGLLGNEGVGGGMGFVLVGLIPFRHV
jgi:hypothetical protein